MKVMVLGANGYLGWPTCLRLSSLGHEVIAIDNDCKKRLMEREGVFPLVYTESIAHRCRKWKEVTGKTIRAPYHEVTSDFFMHHIKRHAPDAIIHYAEQPSAPYSMIDRERCVETQMDNIKSTLNILWAIKGTDTHLIKLGTMGEYGTPGIKIPEGWLEVECSGDEYDFIPTNKRSVKLPFPKLPGSFYHASKVADSVNIEFACRAWGIRATDLNQGIVYGAETEETLLSYDLKNVFYYDSIFGTALNRFVVQAMTGNPITVYGSGTQTRAWLHIEDTLQCVQLALENPAERGEFKVRNQFAEIFCLADLAEWVVDSIGGKIQRVDNPRVEQENHFYEASNKSFLELGFKPKVLTPRVIKQIADFVENKADNICRDQLNIRVDWR